MAEASSDIIPRGTLRLSTVAHLRAVHRRRVISEAIADGIWHFRLDVPRRMLDRLTPGSVVARHLWRVRTWTEWQSIAQARNEARGTLSSFDTLGLHHGDFSYLLPVPARYYEDAVREGERWRRRWLAQARPGAPSRAI